MSEYIKIIGIDCATEAQNIGLSLGIYGNNSITLKETRLGSKYTPVAETISSWICPNEKVLLSIDAPLGWPINLGQVLYSHSAGQGIDINANDLFRRETDRFVKRKLGKQPLDVGADRIARTAHSALKILNELRALTKKPIELAWCKENLADISVIEVYPAATLDCYGITSMGYKYKDQKSARKEIVKGLCSHIIMPENKEILEGNADALDSAVCLLAGKDFLDGDVYSPELFEIAQKEGWIWVKRV